MHASGAYSVDDAVKAHASQYPNHVMSIATTIIAQGLATNGEIANSGYRIAFNRLQELCAMPLLFGLCTGVATPFNPTISKALGLSAV
ncbi:hypothetical protein CA603_23550 [Paraburkholderia hospita]|nr:hypothetical protein CA603_23550 [Paraburkholderia hospita]